MFCVESSTSIPVSLSQYRLEDRYWNSDDEVVLKWFVSLLPFGYVLCAVSFMNQLLYDTVYIEAFTPRLAEMTIHVMLMLFPVSMSIQPAVLSRCRFLKWAVTSAVRLGQKCL